MMTFAIISVLTMALYITVMILKTGGVPCSISDTYYRLSHPKWFSACMGLAGFSFLLAALDVTPADWQFLVFLTFVGMALVALSPNFKKKSDAVLHYVGTALVLAGSQTWVAVTTPWLLPVWLLPLVYIVRYLCRYRTGNWINDLAHARAVFWCEVTALLIAYLNLFAL